MTRIHVPALPDEAPPGRHPLAGVALQWWDHSGSAGNSGRNWGVVRSVFSSGSTGVGDVVLLACLDPGTAKPSSLKLVAVSDLINSRWTLYPSLDELIRQTNQQATP